MEFMLPGCVVQLRRQIGDEGTGCVEEPMGDFRRKSPCMELVGKIFLKESQQVSMSNRRCKYILQNRDLGVCHLVEEIYNAVNTFGTFNFTLGEDGQEGMKSGAGKTLQHQVVGGGQWVAQQLVF
jgi:hypothetical protein